MFTTKAQDSLWAAYYLTGPKGLTYKQADELMKTMPIHELEMLGKGVKELMAPMFEKAGKYSAKDFNIALAKQSAETLKKLEDTAAYAAAVSDRSLMSAILANSNYSIETKSIVKVVKKQDEFGKPYEVLEWKKPKNMTDEEFIEYKNKLRTEVQTKGIGRSRYETIKQVREYFDKELDNIIEEGSLRKYFYDLKTITDEEGNVIKRYNEARKKVVLP